MKCEFLLLLLGISTQILSQRTVDTTVEIKKAESNFIYSPDTNDLTEIRWIDPIDKKLGRLISNRQKKIIWRFRNVGKRPLHIENVTASCGCVIPHVPKKNIAPGQLGTISAIFNGSGYGTILKQVHVLGNLKPNREKTLSFTAEIIEDKKL